MVNEDIGSHCSAASTAVRVGRALVACALFAFLCSCGSRFVYNRLDWLSHYYVSSQVTLDRPQSRALQSDLDGFFEWHRRSELPRYAQFLDRMANDAAQPVSVAQLDAGQREVEGFMRTSAAHAAPDAARWLDGLRPEQVDELFSSLAEKDRKARAEYCEASPAERREKSAHRFVDRVEEWTGSLSRPQRELIRTRYVALGRDDCEEIGARERSRGEFRALVDRYRSTPEFATRIADFLAHRPADLAYRERFLRLLVDINHSLSPTQREQTVTHLRLYARELRGLAAETT
jgi:hypothetical protein